MSRFPLWFLRRATTLVAAVAALCLSVTGVSSVAAATTATQNWAPVNTSIAVPSPRYDASMVYDATTGNVVLFGGLNVSALADTWTWNGSAWIEQTPSASPPALADASMVYDAATHDVVLFGGEGNGGPSSQTWLWNGVTWTPQLVTGPAARSGASMAYDAATQNVVLFGGVGIGGPLSDTWLWNGVSWTLVTLAIATPSPRYDASMAYDTATHDVMLYGGLSSTGTLGTTWSWNGSTWTQESVAGPAPRSGASMVSDATSGDLVLFGGFDATVDAAATWVWNGTYWSALSSTSSPSGRFGASMAEDAATNSVLLFGGDTGSSALSDTWTFVVAPGKPLDVRATSNADAESVVSWSAPDSTSSSALLAYSVIARDVTAATRGGQTCSTTGVTTCTVTGLTNGDQYVFNVSAANGVGPGAAATSNAVRPATVPGAPTITKVVPGDAQAILTWSPPTLTGGTPVGSYRVTAAPGGAFCHVPRAMTSCRITGLTSATDYSFTVTATNAAGTGPTSQAVAIVLPRSRPSAGVPTLPGAPIITSTSVGRSEVTVRWRAPGSNGGVRLIGYDVFVGATPGGESTRPLASVPYNSFAFTLYARPGHSVFIYVRAVNVVGTGPLSNQGAASAK